MGVLVEPKAGLENLEKKTLLTLPGLERQPLGRPVRSQSLYLLRYHFSKSFLILPSLLLGCTSHMPRVRYMFCPRNYP
jgi:hypothetical protein